MSNIELTERLRGAGVAAEILDSRDVNDAKKLSALSGKKSLDVIDFLRYAETLRSDKNSAPQIEEFNKGIETRIEGRPLGIIIPGLAPFVDCNGGSFLNLARYLERKGMGIQIFSYNWQNPFEDYTEFIAEKINILANAFRGKTLGTYLIGHSTGADIIRYASNERLINDVRGFVLASPSTNGIVPDWTDRKIFGKHTDYCNPDAKYNVLSELQKPLDTPALTLINRKDAFVPPAASVDNYGRNVVLHKMSHVRGTGINPGYNRVYMECVRELIGALGKSMIPAEMKE